MQVTGDSGDGGQSRSAYLLARTGSGWKLPLGLLWAPGFGFGLILLSLIDALEWSRAAQGILAATGLLLMGLSYVWVFLTVQCRHCGARLLWLAITSHTFNEWLGWVGSLRVCPVCGR